MWRLGLLAGPFYLGVFPPVSALLASDPNPLDPTNPAVWTSFGLAGVVMLAFARGWVVAGDLLKRSDARAEAAELALREVIPALARLNDAADRMLMFVTEQEKRRR